MKKLSLFISAFALCSSVSYMAMAAESVNCAQLPSCESLGYTDTVSECVKYIRCPFDLTKGKCLHEVPAGTIQYIPGNNTRSGWLLCDGGAYKKSKYPDLVGVIGTRFCTDRHGGACASDEFRVPDYRGYFLRAKGTPRILETRIPGTRKTQVTTDPFWTSNDDFYKPQRNQLSGGTFLVPTTSFTPTTGAFSVVQQDSSSPVMISGGGDYLTLLHAKFSYGGVINERRDSSLLEDVSGWGEEYYAASQYDGGVIPQNYAVNAYIYAGRVILPEQSDEAAVAPIIP